MKPTGKQHVAEFFNCSKDILNDVDEIERILKESILASDIELISISSHKYAPIGVTAIAIVSESHVAIHTYPEARHASIDIYTCSRGPASATILSHLKDKLEPFTTRIAVLSRGNPIEVTDTNWITDDTGSAGFDIRYHIENEIYGKISQYQDIRIIDNETFGKMLFLDNDLQISEYDAHLYNASMASPLIDAGIPLDHIAILGGGDGGVLWELLKQSAGKVSLIDIDGEVVKACKAHLTCICHGAFDDDRCEVINDDVFNYLDGTHQFDAIIYDLTMHPEAFIDMDREIFLTDLFTKVISDLKQGGVVSVQCCSEHDKETLELTKRLLAKFLSDVKFTRTFIPSYCTSWVFASGIKS
ncbi:MAG: adenosylmethionine decarboxylase [Deltaproteobacteria bacterium]|nr:adenosylmethionine decarboxylase [Deltaproteobacteria bacterium]